MLCTPLFLHACVRAVLAGLARERAHFRAHSPGKYKVFPPIVSERWAPGVKFRICGRVPLGVTHLAYRPP